MLDAGVEHWHGESPRPDSPASQEAARIQEELVQELRRQDPRIRRSKRRQWYELVAWAESVLGKERADAVSAPFAARIKAIAAAQGARRERADKRLAALAPFARPVVGPEREWRHEGYSDSPFNEEFSRRQDTARELVAIARRLGAPARAVHQRGHWQPLYGRWRRGYTAGAGFEIYAGVAHEADLGLLDIHAAALRERFSAAFDAMHRLRQEGRDVEREQLWRDYQAEVEALRREGEAHITDAPPTPPAP